MFVKCRLFNYCVICALICRPKASPGLWLCCLLPTAYLAGALKHQLALTDEYKFSLIIVFGLMFQSFEIYVKLNNCWRTIAGVDLIARLLPAVCSAAFISICLHQGKRIKDCIKSENNNELISNLIL